MPSSDPINQCVRVREKGERKRRDVLLTPKGRRWGSVCLSCGRSRHSWKNRGKGGLVGEGPWTLPKLSGE